ncbi:hypothetical protein DTL42_08530 [Bremerella cremea]|uniref:HEAT repeat domain-containing protein n=1 Tax=Bremerella cremea TaxID=1031537 RepID=A0A368KT92_9BACT|nr:hypothetical protein [Bremerella cremea]RCS52865.1 hypothetical protein DTL42_08530 [Bremerella cremea]
MNQAKPSRVAKWMWEGSILLIVILAGVLFWQYQSAEKANRALFLQNQKLEREISDEKKKIASIQAAIVTKLDTGVPLIALHPPSHKMISLPDPSSYREIEAVLIRQLHDKRQQVQAHALVGLCRVVGRQGNRSLFVTTVVRETIPCLHNPRLRYYALNLLREIGPQAKEAVPDILATVSGEYWFPVQKAAMDARRIDPQCDLSEFLARYIVEDRYGKETFKNLIENFKPQEVALAYEAAAALAKTPEKKTHIQQVQAYMKSPAARAGWWSARGFQGYLKSVNQPQETK